MEANVEPIIQVEGLKKYFGAVKAVDDISFQVERGELFGFLGINGAGKSTTINMLCTVLKPTSGQAEICGFKVGKENEKIRRRIGVVYQNNCLDERLTVKENLFIRGALYEKNSRKLSENISRICEILELENVYGRKFKMLSGGQKRRCEIARALVNTPEIMFLDEPTTGLDPATRKAVWESLARLRKEEKMTIFLTTHYMEEAARASHIAVIDGGRLKEYGTPFALKETYAKDKLKLLPKEGKTEELGRKLQELQVTFREKEECLVTVVPESLSALPVLYKVRDLIGGFEMIQGTMDDVFLNVTGKKLEA
ncbi:MAG: ABC transporter ATP-binding protein [Lachnospiraceae bacterium]|nr:ABC transporter ATP-binding protein [Lachnospiraceae bacterium]